MSTIQTAIRELQQEHEAILQKAGDIERAIDALQRLDRAGLTPAVRTTVAVTPTRHVAPTKAKPATTTGPAGDGVEAELLAVLRRAGEPMKPTAVAKALNVSVFTIRRYLKPLVKRRLVSVTGNTNQRRVSLPGRPAKEDL